MTALAALIRRDIRIALRVGGGALIGVLFFLTVTVLMPFAVGPDLALLTRLGPAILWLGALLASLLTLDRLFMADHEDGSLDLIVMGRTPLELACAAKALAHWLAAGLPLIIATPASGCCSISMPRHLGGGADAAGGHAGADLYRHDRRGAGVTLHRGGLVARGAGAAAVDPGADLLASRRRRPRYQGRCRLERRFRSCARSRWSVS
jgi:heme exporter protein CcmB